MKKLLFLTFLFVAQFGFGQIIIKQSNKVNFYETVWVATNGSTPNDTAGYVAKFLSNGDMYLKPNTPVVGYVLTAADTNGKATWQAAGGSGGYSPWDTTATAIVQKDTTLKVGINTTVPLEPFDVRGGFLMVQGDLFTGSVDLVQISGDTALYPFVTMQHSVPNGQVNAGNRSVEMDSISGGGVYIRANNGGIGAQTDLAIRGQGVYIVDQTNGDTLVFVEQATNRVGINATAPEQALDVDGNIKASGGYFAGIRTVSDTATFQATDYTIISDNADDLFLPSAVGIEGRVYVAKNMNAGAMDLVPNGSETIDGSATFNLVFKASVMVQSNGVNWFVISHYH